MALASRIEKTISHRLCCHSTRRLENPDSLLCMADTEPAPEPAAAAATEPSEAAVELADCARYGEEEEVQQVRVLLAPPSANYKHSEASRRSKELGGGRGQLLRELAVPVDIFFAGSAPSNTSPERGLPDC